MQTEQMTVTGMTCGGCTNNVTRALRAVDGVSAVSVSLSTGEANVQYDDRLTNPEKLRAAVKVAGYGVGANNASGSQKTKGGCCD